MSGMTKRGTTRASSSNQRNESSKHNCHFKMTTSLLHVNNKLIRQRRSKICSESTESAPCTCLECEGFAPFALFASTMHVLRFILGVLIFSPHWRSGKSRKVSTFPVTSVLAHYICCYSINFDSLLRHAGPRERHDPAGIPGPPDTLTLLCAGALNPRPPRPHATILCTRTRMDLPTAGTT